MSGPIITRDDDGKGRHQSHTTNVSLGIHGEVYAYGDTRAEADAETVKELLWLQKRVNDAIDELSPTPREVPTAAEVTRYMAWYDAMNTPTHIGDLARDLWETLSEDDRLQVRLAIAARALALIEANPSPPGIPNHVCPVDDCCSKEQRAANRSLNRTK